MRDASANDGTNGSRLEVSGMSMKLTDISPAIALTPLDGRYHKQTAPLVEYMSEPALNRERMRVEVEWMILLANGFEGNGNQPIVPKASSRSPTMSRPTCAPFPRTSAPKASSSMPLMRPSPTMM